MTSIAILYPGEMGSAFAQALKAAGHRIVSPLNGRSERTRSQASKVGIETHSSLQESVEEAAVILSLVPPGGVFEVAGQVIDACRKTGTAPLFIDMNAKTPSDALMLSRKFSEASLPFINACIIGRASHLVQEGRIYTSGPDVSGLEELFKGLLPVITLGERIEQASAFKMCFSGFNKTMASALFETANTANAFGIEAPLFALIGKFLGGTMNDMARLVPTYPRHIARRAEEMRALARMLDEAGLPNAIAAAAAETFEAIASQGALQSASNEQDMAGALRLLHYENTNGAGAI